MGPPRASGADPHLDGHWRCTCQFSPRERGWSHLHVPLPPLHDVLPAHAGLTPSMRWEQWSCPKCSHASGADPVFDVAASMVKLLSPRERGWFTHSANLGQVQAVPPARTGWSVDEVNVACGADVLPARAGWSLRTLHPPPDGLLSARAGLIRPGASGTGASPSSPRASRAVPRSDAARGLALAVLPTQTGLVSPPGGRWSTSSAPRPSGGSFKPLCDAAARQVPGELAAPYRQLTTGSPSIEMA
ncbi:hypothetical protein H4W30_004796 [Amycolatopsis roodepoortensis]|uniref:Uncharacterized protein n=1 Tax=Amycolatopsis roodepoortensis TaxID=700274 RepID=A0ABR9LCB2_9PSEU|nr:hypothetical protein [Amycolatopsis roodepoortensis]